jgi:energy-coupling factor transporter ATP-binding protein EcfA2
LILDEATSNLDAEAQVAVVETVKHLKGSLTILAVSHQDLLIEAADRIYRLPAADRSRAAPRGRRQAAGAWRRPGCAGGPASGPDALRAQSAVRRRRARRRGGPAARRAALPVRRRGAASPAGEDGAALGRRDDAVAPMLREAYRVNTAAVFEIVAMLDRRQDGRCRSRGASSMGWSICVRRSPRDGARSLWRRPWATPR